jgi:hypothetical protein
MLKFTTRFVNKVSDWLLEEPIHLLRVFDWFFFATSSQSETLFTNLVVNFLGYSLHVNFLGYNTVSASQLM